ncbi:HNH endonuclease [Methylobacillus arboreus]|uniref:HNH endonuclease n=1 Tax=Methylobacillus arboreus TaxID=755170 RepID=UPI001E42C858|nr:HNH endonuclease [Methylobacillus arboreus]MCB5191575.1 HNH endonuclease [Methylobacillus arboreus]
MNKKTAIDVGNILIGQLENCTEFQVIERKEKLPLEGFHTFANGKPCLGAFKIGRASEKGLKLWLLVIDWKDSGNYYIVIYPENHNLAPIAELHDQQNNRDSVDLIWTYSPRKRDEQNALRKRAFVEAVGSIDYIVSLPSALVSLEDFLDDIFNLAFYRMAADDLDETVLKREVTRSSFPEGRRIERLHKYRERDSQIVRQAKKTYAERNGGVLPCEVCGFDFSERYGELGASYIEAHHTLPLSDLDEGEVRDTQVEDFTFVCANCHRMLHRKRPWVSIEKLRTILLRK